jgi:hypothetical protein
MISSSDLTLKQKTFIKLYNRGISGTKAARIAYNANTENTAAVIASENLKKPKIRNELHIHFIYNGGVDLSIRAITEGLKATKYNRYTKQYDPDHKTRLKASKQAMKLLESIKFR